MIRETNCPSPWRQSEYNQTFLSLPAVRHGSMSLVSFPTIKTNILFFGLLVCCLFFSRWLLESLPLPPPGPTDSRSGMRRSQCCTVPPAHCAGIPPSPPTRRSSRVTWGLTCCFSTLRRRRGKLFRSSAPFSCSWYITTINDHYY